MLVRERVSMCGTGVQGEGTEGRTFIRFLYLCNQRDMLMLFFSFSVTWGSETGLGEGRGRGKEVQSLAPFGSLANHMLFSLILLG